jgi:hypothetical protein
MTMHKVALVLGLFTMSFAGSALAQDEPDWGDESLETADQPVHGWVPLVELLLRGDRVSGLPAGREDLERVRSRVRVGVTRAPLELPGFEFGAVLEGAIGTGANKHSLINNDIEEVDAIGLDQLWLRKRLFPAERVFAQLEIGKTRLPLELTPLLWDDDLRPTGASFSVFGEVGDFDRWSIDAGVFRPNPLDETGPRLAALQLGWHWREGAPTSGGVLFGLLDWGDLDDYARAGLGRGNTIVAGRYRHDYRLLDAQAYLRHRLGDKTLEARVDLVRNLGADDGAQRRGTRASVVWGDRFAQPGFEFGWAWQRMQRDAVLAAVTADDWWFHTAARGHMPWIGYGFGGAWSVRLAAFFETRDGLDERTERLLLDIEARW